MKPRFSLFTMLAVLTLLSVPLAWITQGLRERADIERPLHEMRQRGAYFYVDDRLPRHPVYKWFEDGWDIERIVDVSMPDGGVTDDDLRAIQHLPNVTGVWVDCDKVTDEGVMCLTSLPKLRTLTVISEAISPDLGERFWERRMDVKAQCIRREQ